MLRVLHLDDHLVVVSKPAGIPAQPDRTGDTSLLEMVQAGHPKAGLVHRLDRPVSGVMLFARTAASLDACHALFREHRVKKTYWAIVEGIVHADANWRHHLMEDQRSRRARVLEHPAAGSRAAELHVRSLAIGERYTLLELEPVEGRFHQLRAQCAAVGHPIKGDVKYGARRGEADRSIALHARSLRFVHPVLGGEIFVVAPAPAGALWDALLNKAGIIDVRSPE